MFAHGYAGIQHSIEHNRHIFQDLVSRALVFLQQNRYVAAAAYAQIAASYALDNHPGLFASPRLERLLHALGLQVVSQGVCPERRGATDGNPGHVLHVFTLTTGIGGHTRMVWRWMQQDAGRKHSVVLTRQGSLRIPQQLKDAVTATQGEMHVLDHAVGDILTWARRLREIAVSADLVVLHINPNDIIPSIAFADRRGTPPIVLLNHADHVFWVGAGISDLVANQRDSGMLLAQRRRGVATLRCGMLPIALDTRQRKLTRSEAKAQLGLAEDTVVMLSIARPHKYAPLTGCSTAAAQLNFPDVAVPILRKHANAVFLAVGPDEQGAWADASAATQGRVRALGVQTETAIFYQAADIYLDSFPFTSITSLLEAGRYGVPLVSCQPFGREADVLCADTPALSKQMLRASDAEAYHHALTRLIEDDPYRQELGAAICQDIAATHAEAGWKQFLQDVYVQAATLSRAAPLSACDEQQDITELDLLLVTLFGGKAHFDTLVQSHLRLLPLDLRLSWWMRMLRKDRTFRPGLLLPEWAGTRLEKWRYPAGREYLLSQ